MSVCIFVRVRDAYTYFVMLRAAWGTYLVPHTEVSNLRQKRQYRFFNFYIGEKRPPPLNQGVRVFHSLRDAGLHNCKLSHIDVPLTAFCLGRFINGRGSPRTR